MYQKKVLIFLLSFSLSFTSLSFTKEKYFSFAITNANENNIANVHNNSVENHARVQKKQAPQKQPPALLPVQVPSLPASKESLVTQCKKICFEHPYLTTLGIFLSVSYLITLSSLYRAQYVCDNQCKWAFWHDELSPKQLQQVPAQDVAKALFATIANVYQKERESGDFLTPILCFSSDLERELAWHNHFLSMHRWLNKTYLGILFPQQKTAIINIMEQRERLIVLRLIFVTWLHSYTNNGMTHEQTNTAVL